MLIVFFIVSESIRIIVFLRNQTGEITFIGFTSELANKFNIIFSILNRIQEL